MGPEYGWMHGGGFGMWLWIIVLVVVVVLVGYFLADLTNRRTRDGRGAPGPDEVNETPLDLLKKRYARGEITREEYQRIKADLMD